MLDPAQPISQIVLDHPETAAVFHRHAIDFCCHGHQRLADACTDVRILTELETAVAARPSHGPDPRTLSTTELIRYIVKHHHDYLRVALPTAISLATKVWRVHGARREGLETLVHELRELEDALVPHLDEEETEIFPALEADVPDRAAIARMLDTMEDEHAVVGELLAAIRGAADDYAIPDWACRTYRTLMSELSTLEADIKQHVHLENHVLAPRFAA